MSVISPGWRKSAAECPHCGTQSYSKFPPPLLLAAGGGNCSLGLPVPGAGSSRFGRAGHYTGHCVTSSCSIPHSSISLTLARGRLEPETWSERSPGCWPTVPITIQAASAGADHLSCHQLPCDRDYMNCFVLQRLSD